MIKIFKIKILIFNILIFFLAIFIIEILSGISLTKKLNCNYLLCNAHYVYKTDLYTTEKIIINYQKDKYGFRGNDNSYDDIKFLIVGGSTTDERYLNEESTWAGQLKIFFNNKINILNAGIDGQSSTGHIWNFNNWFNRVNNFKAKYIIFYIGINEIANNNSYYDLEYKNLNILKKIKFLLRDNNGFFFRSLKKLMIIKQKNSQKVFHDKNRKLIKINKIPTKNDFKHNLEITQKNLNELYNLTNNNKSIPIFITQKTNRWSIIDDKVLSIDNFNYYLFEKNISEIILNFCYDNKILCINGFEELKFNTNDTYDLIHTSPSGSKKIAELVFEKIKDLDLDDVN